MRWSRPPPAQKPAGAQGTTAIKPLIKSEISLIPQQPRNMSLLSTIYRPSLHRRYIRPREAPHMSCAVHSYLSPAHYPAMYPER